jgi:predicted transcriptional regulator YdeE
VEEMKKVDAITEDRKRFIWHKTVKPLINDDIIAEHKADPFGDHTPELDMVLAFTRSDPIQDKPRLIVVIKTPEKEWVVGEHDRRKGEVIRTRGEIYDSLEEIQHVIFLERLKTIESSYA